MKKVALVFLFAVIVPSLALAWLAVRSARDQQLALERQQTLLAEEAGESVVRRLADELVKLRSEFTNTAEALIARSILAKPVSAAPDPAQTPLENFAELRNVFDEQLRSTWPEAAVGFAVSYSGECYSPSVYSGPDAQKFRLNNEKFLCNRESLEVVWKSPKGRVPLSDLEPPPTKSSAVWISKESAPITNAEEKVTSFRDLIGSDREGAVARFINGQLSLLVWYRPSQNPFTVFGAQLRPAALRQRLAAGVHLDSAMASQLVAVLLDDDRLPVAQSLAGFNATGRRPVAAADVGEVLPHWRVAVFPADPARMNAMAQTTRSVVSLLIVVLILAIGVGSWLIVADLRRQLALARQKTDFVSNVSHELKTPLTSIRMFAELLAEDRVLEPAKRKQFLGIIGAESARLTRLINNVLDFARLERGEKTWQFVRLDLREVVGEAVDACRPQLETAGIAVFNEMPAAPVPVSGDHDALVQVIVNLLSNVEKYATAGREATVRLVTDRGHCQLEILDRGAGIPTDCEERVFEQFFRAHDSLASGIPGSGLGLTLARQIIRGHGGELTCSRREGGGCRLLARLPLDANHAQNLA